MQVLPMRSNPLAQARLEATSSPESTETLDAIDALNPTDAQILISIRASAKARNTTDTLRCTLQDRAGLFIDFNHFRRLCLTDLRQAFTDDRNNKTHLTKNRRRTWFAMFRYFATHAGIQRTLEIRALDRQELHLPTHRTSAAGRMGQTTAASQNIRYNRSGIDRLVAIQTRARGMRRTPAE